MTTKMGRYRYWGDQKPDTDRPLLTLTRPSEAVAASVSEALGDADDQALGSVGTLRIYGPIDSWGGWWGVSAKDVARALDLLGNVDTVVVRVNSPGGESFEGRAIMNLLRAHASNCIAIVDGLAASAASYVAVGCDETVMAPGTMLMIHDTHMFVYGPSDELRKAADVADSITRAGSELYADVAGGTPEQWREIQRAETWYTASEAVEAGLADRVGIVPDAGPAETAADDEDPAEIDSEVEDRVDAEYDLSIFIYAGREQAPAPALPSAPASGSEESQEGSPTVPLLDTMRTKLGLPEDADEAAIEAAYEKSLETEPKETAPASETKVPEGHVVIPQQALADLQENATKGAAAAEQLRVKDREDFLDAHRDRFPPASREAWQKQYDADPKGTREWLEKAAVIVPIEELGHAEDSEAADDVTESTAYQNWSM